MNSGFKSQAVPSYRLLSEDQIKEIHLASLEILETVGVRVNHEEAVAMLRGAGCRISGQDVVKMPGWLVEECIRSAPSRITIYDRRGQEAMRLEGRKSYFGMGTDLIRTYDLGSGELRRSTRADVATAARVADACAEVDFIASFALANEVRTNLMYIECFRAQVENSTKPIFFTAAGQEDLAIILEMAGAVAGGAERLREKPFLIQYSEPTPPLTHSFGAVSKLFLCADRGIPITYTPGAILGASAPVTLAGGIAQANAEALSGIVLHQLRAKGAPIISGLAVVPLDMLTSVFCYGAPEWRLTNSAYADLYHYYGIPMWSTVGTDSHAFDAQAGMEHAFGTLLAALDGANLIHDIGYMGQGLIGHPAMILMSNEIIGWVKRVLRGFDINEDTLALNVIRSVGPGGDFLAEDHTREHFRSELWRPRVANRLDPDTWIQRGKKAYHEAAIAATNQILASHHPEPLDAKVQASLSEIASRSAAALSEKHFIA
jgi:trimethylamine--corrinoid protein Co-methyltransferase